MVAGRSDEALEEVTREAAVPTPEARKRCLPAGGSPALSLCLPRLIELGTPPSKAIRFCCSLLHVGPNRPHRARIGKGLPQGRCGRPRTGTEAYAPGLSSPCISPGCLKSPSQHGASLSLVPLVSESFHNTEHSAPGRPYTERRGWTRR